MQGKINMDKNKKKRIKELFKGMKNYYDSKLNENLLNEQKEKYGVSNKKIYTDTDLMLLLYEKLEHEEKKYIDLTFRYDMTVYEVIERLYISESTYYRNMNKIYEKLIKYVEKFDDLFNI